MAFCYFNGWGFGSKFTPPIFKDKNDVYIYSSSSILSSDIKTGLKQVNSEIKEDTFSLIGWSLGGMLAIEFANLYPERVRSLSLLSTTNNFINNDSERLDLLRKLQNSLEDFFNKNEKTGLVGFYTSLIKEIPLKELTDCLPSIKELIQHAEFLPSKGLYNGLCYLEKSNLKNICENLNIPTKIFHGTKDQTTPINHAYNLNQDIKESKLIEIESAGHMLPYSHSSIIKKHLDKL